MCVYDSVLMRIVHTTVIYSIYRYNILFKSIALQTYMFCGGGGSFIYYLGATMMQGCKLLTKLLVPPLSPFIFHYSYAPPLCQSIFKYPSFAHSALPAPGVRTVAGGKMELTVVRLSGEETVLTVQEV